MNSSLFIKKVEKRLSKIYNQNFYNDRYDVRLIKTFIYYVSRYNNFISRDYF